MEKKFDRRFKTNLSDEVDNRENEDDPVPEHAEHDERGVRPLVHPAGLAVDEPRHARGRGVDKRRLRVVAGRDDDDVAGEHEQEEEVEEERGEDEEAGRRASTCGWAGRWRAGALEGRRAR